MTAFLKFSGSTIQQIHRNEIHSLEDKKILGVVKKSGEEVIFTKRSSVWFEGNRIRSRARKYTTVVLNYEDINRINKKEITTKDGKSYFLTDFRRIRDDEKAGKYVSDKTIDIISVPLSDVKQFIVLNRGRGAIKGCILGSLIGGSIGLINIILHPLPRSDKHCKLVMIAFPPLCAFCGMLTGLVLGMIKGVQERYIVDGPKKPGT